MGKGKYDICDSLDSSLGVWGFVGGICCLIILFGMGVSFIAVGPTVYKCGMEEIISDYEMGTCQVINGSTFSTFCTDSEGGTTSFTSHRLEVQITREDNQIVTPTSAFAGGSWCSGSESPNLQTLLARHPINSSFDCYFRSNPRDYPGTDGLLGCFDTPDLWAYDNFDEVDNFRAGFLTFTIIGIAAFIVPLLALSLFIASIADEAGYVGFFVICCPCLAYETAFIAVLLVPLVAVVLALAIICSPVLCLAGITKYGSEALEEKLQEYEEMKRIKNEKDKLWDASHYRKGWWDVIETITDQNDISRIDPCVYLPLDNLLTIFGYVLCLPRQGETAVWSKHTYIDHFSDFGRFSSVSSTWNYFTSHPRLWKRIAKRFDIKNDENDPNYNWKGFVLLNFYEFKYKNKLTTKLYQKHKEAANKKPKRSSSSSSISMSRSDDIRLQAFNKPTLSDGPYTTSPQTDMMAPQTDMMSPQTDMMSPQTDTMGPRADTMGPQSDTMGPQTDMMSPQSDLPSYAQALRSASSRSSTSSSSSSSHFI